MSLLRQGQVNNSIFKFNTLTFITSFILFTAVLYSCKKSDNTPTDSGEIVYVETNNFADNQNAVLAYRNKGDGKPEQIAGSPFLTKGAGLGNPNQILGPDDQETPLIISGDRKFLFAVNSGSSTIAVFTIKADGVLEAVTGSPFSSGGQNPVSLSMWGQYLYVANKSQDPIHGATQVPNYTVFTVGADGVLAPVSGGKYETTPGVSPAQVLVSNDKKFLFTADFLGFMLTPARGTLRSFTISPSGTITPVAGTPLTIPGAGGALGLWQHPAANTLYVGFPVQGKVGIYSIDPSSGALTFSSAVDAGPAACWIRTNKAGDHLYTLNSAENTISVFNSANSLVPVPLDKFTLKNSGPKYAGANGAMPVTSEPFSLGFSRSEKYLYVVNQHTNTDFTIGNFNYFHVLHVAADGRLTEPDEPILLPVANNIRPQGIAVY